MISNKLGTTNYKSDRPITNALVIKKQINAHINVQTGIQDNSNINFSTTKTSNNQKPFSASIPVTLQYYMLNKHHKVNPFLEGGLLASIGQNRFSNNNDKIPLQTNSNGNHYISIVFTQGVTYEINTKIEVTQSFHFISNTDNKTIGIDLGIGYKLP